MRLIDADALMGMVFNDVVLIDGDVKGAGLILADAVEEAPTVDAEVVVRCKDCIYTRKVYGRLVCKYGTCSGCILCEDFFCANGERKMYRGDNDACL